MPLIHWQEDYSHPNIQILNTNLKKVGSFGERTTSIDIGNLLISLLYNSSKQLVILKAFQ